MVEQLMLLVLWQLSRLLTIRPSLPAMKEVLWPVLKEALLWTQPASQDAAWAVQAVALLA